MKSIMYHKSELRSKLVLTPWISMTEDGFTNTLTISFKNREKEMNPNIHVGYDM